MQTARRTVLFGALRGSTEKKPRVSRRHKPRPKLWMGRQICGAFRMFAMPSSGLASRLRHLAAAANLNARFGPFAEWGLQGACSLPALPVRPRCTCRQAVGFFEAIYRIHSRILGLFGVSFAGRWRGQDGVVKRKIKTNRDRHFRFCFQWVGVFSRAAHASWLPLLGAATFSPSTRPAGGSRHRGARSRRRGGRSRPRCRARRWRGRPIRAGCGRPGRAGSPG